jgi:hypothetical protein
VAVVLRRGPSAWARLSVWHTDTDEMEHGQWVRARIYERRCDVSPDGRLFACFAHQGSGRRRELNTDSWAAISRPPWVSALAVWGVGTTYFAGGFFLGANELLLGGVKDPPDRGRLPGWLQLSDTLPFRDPTPEWPDRLVYFNRLLRDGWRADPGPESSSPVWSRRVTPGGPALTMLPGSSSHSAREFFLERPTGLTALGPATWADWDHAGRLIMAREGRLVHVVPETGEARLLHDFADQRPEAIEAPAWAREWPPAP